MILILLLLRLQHAAAHGSIGYYYNPSVGYQVSFQEEPVLTLSEIFMTYDLPSFSLILSSLPSPSFAFLLLPSSSFFFLLRFVVLLLRLMKITSNVILDAGITFVLMDQVHLFVHLVLLVGIKTLLVRVHVSSAVEGEPARPPVLAHARIPAGQVNIPILAAVRIAMQDSIKIRIRNQVARLVALVIIVPRVRQHQHNVLLE